jgi:hypothetical protein
MINALYRVRARVAPRLAAGTRFIGLGIVALGGFLAAEGHATIGVVVLVASVPATWLTGVWVVPWSMDAYFVRLSNIINDSYINLQYENHRQREQLKDIANEIKGLDPPRDRLDLHQQILTDICRVDEILNDKSVSFSDRAIDILGPSRSLRHAYTELDHDSREPYVSAVAGALGRYKDRIDEDRERNQQSLRRLLVRANKLGPPGSLAERHGNYLRALDEYVSSMSAYYAAIRDREAIAIRKAAGMVEVAYADLEATSHRYVTELQLRTHHTAAKTHGTGHSG